MAHPVFDLIDMNLFDSKNLDDIINSDGLKVLFLWGYNCPNCEVAKTSLEIEAQNIKKLPFKWYHCNVYEDFEVSTRFGLHGIPVFLVYKGSKSLGRITSYPGFDPFYEALEKVARTHGEFS